VSVSAKTSKQQLTANKQGAKQETQKMGFTSDGDSSSTWGG